MRTLNCVLNLNVWKTFQTAVKFCEQVKAFQEQFWTSLEFEFTGLAVHKMCRCLAISIKSKIMFENLKEKKKVGKDLLAFGWHWLSARIKKDGYCWENWKSNCWRQHLQKYILDKESSLMKACFWLEIPVFCQNLI